MDWEPRSNARLFRSSCGWSGPPDPQPVHLQQRAQMPRIKRKSSRLGTIHDRRSRDLPLNAEVVAVEVDDPMALELGDKIVALRSTRGDPLGWLHSHHQIDDAQYRGGRAFQNDWERAERGPHAIDPGREYVVGAQGREHTTTRQR